MQCGDVCRTQESGLVFLVNNCDLVLTVFHERHLPRAATVAFEDLLRHQVALFVENQLMRHYPDLVQFVQVAEPLVAGIEEGARAQQVLPPPGQWRVGLDALSLSRCPSCPGSVQQFCQECEPQVLTFR